MNKRIVLLGEIEMDITKAESYLYERLEMLSDEKVLLITKLNKIQIEIEETDNMIVAMAEDVDTAFEVFSPRPKKNDFAREGIAKLEKRKDELKLLKKDFAEQLMKLEGDINTIREVLGEAPETGEEFLYSQEIDNTEEKLYGIQILESQEAERKRIARDLHDSIVQVLTNLVHKCEICSKIMDMDSIRAKLELEIMSKTLKDTISEMRNIIYDLRPMSFDDLGLQVTLERALKSIDAGTDMKVSFTVEGDEQELSPIVQLTIFRIVQECANNSIKYSKGKELDIRLIYEASTVLLEISDDGKGFEYAENTENRDDNHTGFGLGMMRERVALLSGYIDIDTALGKGTVVRVTIPVQ